MGKFMARNKLPFPRNKTINHGNGLPSSVWWSIVKLPQTISSLASSQTNLFSIIPVPTVARATNHLASLAPK